MKIKTSTISVERIKECLRYEAETGKLFWRVPIYRSIKVGDEAGGVRGGRGYLYVGLDGASLTAQRVAWALQTGEWPSGKIYFRDRNPRNIQFSNLALARGIKGYDSSTREGRAAYSKAWRLANPEKFREISLKKTFGIDLRQYGEMMVSQGGKCAICKMAENGTRLGKRLALAVDHNHTTGDVRGLLCRNCNTLIGHAKEDRDRLRSAIAYLDKYNGTGTNVVPLKKVGST